MRQMVIMLGAPGSGKGTQAKMVFEKFDYPQISTGDMLRDAVRRGTELGLKAKAAMDAGELVSDDVVIGIIAERLQAADCRAGCILDGFPRTVEQARALENLGAGKFDTRALFFDVPEEALIKRLAGRRNCSRCGAIYNIHHAPPAKADACDRCGGVLTQRDDDREEVVRRRLTVYREHTEPLVAYYRNRGVLAVIDAQREIPVIFEEVVRAIR